jgi:hypothetical protein
MLAVPPIDQAQRPGTTRPASHLTAVDRLEQEKRRITTVASAAFS